MSVEIISVENAAFESWDHILNVNKGIFSSMNFEHFKCLLDQISKIKALSLAVVNFVS